MKCHTIAARTLFALMQKRGIDNANQLGEMMGGAKKHQVAAFRILNCQVLEPRPSSMKDFARFFGVPVTVFTTGLDNQTDNVTSITDRNGVQQNLKRIPIISWVQAGGFMEIVDAGAGSVDDYVETTIQYSTNTFALIVHGNSMLPEFQPGDRIIVDPSTEARNGSFVVVRMNGDDAATFKQIEFDGGRTLLRPLNHQYQTIDVTGRDFTICGVVREKSKLYA